MLSTARLCEVSLRPTREASPIPTMYRSSTEFRRRWRLLHAGPACLQKINMNTTTANTTQPSYRWNGKYFGFMSNGYLLDAKGTYRGWIDGNGTVWQANGKFLGDLVGGEYVLLRQ